MGFWDIIIPKSDIQWAVNPSAEYDLNGYTAVGGVLTRVTTQQKRGVYSIQTTMTSTLLGGLHYLVTLPIARTYIFSVDILGVAGLGYRIYTYDVLNTVILATYSFTATGLWDRPSLVFVTGAATSIRLYVTKDNHASTATIYVDGFMVTEGNQFVTYFDGDTSGCVWEAFAHQSKSTRLETSTEGGLVYNFDDMDITKVAVEAQVGTGIGPVNNVFTASNIGKGNKLQRSIPQPRTFNLNLWVEGETWQDFLSTRRSFVDLFYPGRAFQLRYRGGTVPVVINAVYDAGFELGNTLGYIEKATIRFTASDPFWYEQSDQGAVLAHNVSLAAYFYRRSPDGTWIQAGGTLNGIVKAIAMAPNGDIYVGGEFSLAAGVSVNYMAKYVYALNTFQTVGGGTPGVAGGTLKVTSIAFRPDGKAYVAGGFTSAGGVANTPRLCLFDPATNTFSSIAASNTRYDVDIYTILYDTTYKRLYIGGNDGGIYGPLAMYTEATTTFATIQSAPDAPVYTLALNNNYLYFGGEFNDVGGPDAHGVARWPLAGGSFELLKTGLGNIAPFALVNKIVFDRSGLMYAVGQYGDASGDDTIQGAGIWNGNNWYPMGDMGILSIGDVVLDHNNRPVIAATSLNIDGFSYGSNIHRFTGSHWIGTDTAASAIEMMFTPDGTWYIGTNVATSTKCGAITQVTNSGTADASVVLVVRGPGSLYWISNNKLGVTVQFTDLSIADGEYVYVYLGNVNNRENRIFSSNRGDLTGKLVPGSQASQFVLSPGIQPIELFMGGSTYDVSKVTAVIWWRRAHWAIEGGTLA